MKVQESTIDFVLGTLRIKRLNLNKFAEKYGYERGTVRQVARRYVGKIDAKPVGKITVKILKDLDKVVFDEERPE